MTKPRSDRIVVQAGGPISPTVTRKSGLSLADRACLCDAREHGVPAYSADRAWADVAADLRVGVALIR